ncbi:hypothetical protein HK096_010898, partial [Nowakowskiella sp. JEL0078]
MAKVLIVGAGAVGQVYGYHLSKGGADVHFLVRPYQLEQLSKSPLRLHELSFGLVSVFKKNPISTNKTKLYHVPKENLHSAINDSVSHIPKDFDAIIITVSASGLRNGNWVSNLWNHVKDSTSNPIVVSFLPGYEDEQFLVEVAKVPRHRLAEGFITLISWQAPLKNQKFDPLPASEYEVGLPSEQSTNPVIVYLAQSAQTISPPPKIAGTDNSRTIHVISVIKETFVRGGLDSSVSPTSINKGIVRVGLALQIAILVGIESADWSFSKLRSDKKLLALVSSAAKESAKVVGSRVKVEGGTGVSGILFAV